MSAKPEDVEKKVLNRKQSGPSDTIQSRRGTVNTKKSEGEALTADYEISKSSSFFHKFWGCVSNFFKQVFTFPLRDEPISFFQNSEFNAKGEYIGTHEKEETSDILESYINYDPVSKQRLEMVLHRRKKDLGNLNRLNFELVDLKKFPLWNEETINYLRTTFKTFDVTKDGLLSLENWNDMLFEMGDQSSEEERESQFYRVSDGDSFIDFPQFLDLLYTITMKDHKSPQTVLLATGVRTANYNISRMKNLDLVQRMQVGMF